MKRIETKKCILLAGIAVLLIVYILQLAFTGRSRVRTMNLAAEPDAIRIQTGDDVHSSILLKKEGEEWFVGEHAYRADNNTVASMVQSLKELTLLATVTRAAGSDSERYGLDDASKLVVTALKDDAVVRTLVVGKNAATNTQSYVQLDGGSAVYLASGTLHTTFATSEGAIRSKSVYTIPAADIVSVSLRRISTDSSLEDNFDIVKEQAMDSTDGISVQSTWSVAVSSGDTAGSLDATKVTSWVNSLATVSAATWLPDGTVPETLWYETVTVETAEKHYTINLYMPQQEDGDYIASCSESAYCFTVPSYASARFEKKLSDLMAD